MTYKLTGVTLTMCKNVIQLTTRYNYCHVLCQIAMLSIHQTMYSIHHSTSDWKSSRYCSKTACYQRQCAKFIPSTVPNMRYV